MTEISKLHMGGLLSNVDTQGIIDKLMVFEQKRITNVAVEKTGIEADLAAWSNISGKMTTLNDAAYALYSSTSTVWEQMTATPSDATKLTATATSSAVEGTYAMTITDLAQAHTVASNTAATLVPADSLRTSTTNLVGTVLTAGHAFKIGPAADPAHQITITVGATESLSSLRTQINTAASAMTSTDRVFASIVDNRLVIARVNTGSTQIEMSNVGGGTALTNLHIWNGATYDNTLITAQNAAFTVNGASVSRSSNTNLTDVIENVTLNLKGKAAVADNLTLTIGRDTETARNAINDFIAAYNDVATQMATNIKVSINATTGTVAAGELQGDQLIPMMQYNLRRLATSMKSPYMDSTNAAYTYDGRTGVVDSLNDIGIWTSDEQNNLSITNETRLDYMLTNYFDEVKQLFQGVAGGSGAEHGVAKDMYDYTNGLTKPLTGTLALKSESVDEKLTEKTALVEKMNKELQDYETSLWDKFTAMENAISKNSQQLSWLTSQLGVGS